MIDASIEELLERANSFPLECDGMARVLSTLLDRDAVEHMVVVGSLHVDHVGRIPHHWWVQLPDDSICDIRAQMWLGAHYSVPHGRIKAESGHHYEAEVFLPPQPLAPAVFQILTGIAMADMPRIRPSAAVVERARG